MKKTFQALIIASIALLALAACGRGGGGGPDVIPKQSTKLYLFGNLSANFNVAYVTTKLTVPNFVDYSASSNDSNSTSLLRSGVIAASGPILASPVSGSFNRSSKVLTLTLTNGSFLNMSSSKFRNGGKGTEIATLVTTPGTILPAVDPNPSVGQFRQAPVKTGEILGCAVNYVP
jgi:hypothetical protein